METGETGETLFFIVLVMRELGCEKKRDFLEISEKCYFFIHFPILELEERILLQQTGDDRLERIDLAGSRTASRSLNRRVQVLRQGYTCQVQVAGDLAHRPMFTVVQPVSFVRTVDIQHGFVVAQCGGKYQRGVLFKKLLRPPARAKPGQGMH
jgi:hypothetical protein